MKYVCFGYFDEEAWAAMSESDQQRFMDDCFAYEMYFAGTARSEEKPPGLKDHLQPELHLT